MVVLHTFPVKGTQKYLFGTELQMFGRKFLGRLAAVMLPVTFGTRFIAMRHLLFPLLFILCISSCVFQKPPQSMYTNQTYGSYTRNKLDVYLPSVHDTNTAVVILIHGGGWVAGNKTDWTSEQINSITQNGYAVAAINYRYADGDFHHQMQDVQTAIDYINSKASLWQIGKNKFALMGASAGGHLSLLYGHGFDSSHVVKAVISLCGPTDMGDSVFQQYANNYAIGYVFQQFLGATEQANPQVFRDASPVNYHSNVPTLLIHGSLDNLVPPAQSQVMFDTLHFYGIATDTTFLGNAGHDVSAGGVNNQQIYSEVKNWLQLYLH